MKITSKVTICLFLYLFLLSISTVHAANSDIGVIPGDVIRWDATKYQENNYFTLEFDWYIIFTVDCPSELNGGLNGSVNQNGTVIDNSALNSLTLSDLGDSPGMFIGDVLDYENIKPKLLSDSSSFANLKIGIETFVTIYSSYYTFIETVPNESFNITGSGVDGSYVWNYSGMVNYTSDGVMYSVDEYYFHNDTESGFIEIKQYQWRRTSFTHGISDDPTIPSFSLPLIIAISILCIASLAQKRIIAK